VPRFLRDGRELRRRLASAEHVELLDDNVLRWVGEVHDTIDDSAWDLAAEWSKLEGIRAETDDGQVAITRDGLLDYVDRG
jgi:hypothetical protein